MKIRLFAVMILSAFVLSVAGTSYAQGEKKEVKKVMVKEEKKTTDMNKVEKKPGMHKKLVKKEVKKEEKKEEKK